MPRTYLRRQYRRRFLRPVIRYRLNGPMLARTCFWGVAWGLTPSVGLQTLFVVITWWIVDRVMGFRFNWLIALVLTLITNPITMAPIYVFYLGVGCTMTNCTMPTAEVDRFVAALVDFNLLELASSAGLLVGEPYALMWLGSLPFVIILSPIAYFFGRKLGDRMEHRRQEKAARRRQSAQRAEALRNAAVAPVRQAGIGGSESV
ncbi:MAG: DUF2062 domain-containing protein [Azospirillaceae bacterium]